ncbi:MAG: protein kinase [Myxococcota bacterium]
MRGAKGEQVGSYVLEELLGQGSMSTVWASRNPSTGTPVALKLVEPHASPLALLASARSWARLRHPHIVRTLECGLHRGDVWLTMELLRGPTLRAYLSEHPLSDWRAGLGWVLHIADALTYLHARGVLHRDLKPSNVMLVDRGPIKLIDFGVATTLSRQEENLGAAGTLRYMPPEALQDGWRPDARVDLYALGCVLYELLTGRHPHDIRTPEDVLALLDLEPPVRPDALRPEIPSDLAELNIALLSAHPATRPGHADEVRAVLSQWVDDAPPALAPEAPLPGHLLTPVRVPRKEPERAMTRALAHLALGRGAMVVVEGRAGSGKSRLLRERLSDSALEHARRDGEVFVLRAAATRAQQNTPLSLLAGFWEDITARLGPRGMPEHLARFLEPRADDVRRRAPPGTSRLALFQGLHGLFRQLLERHPTVLVLDDLQWADELTLEWLRALATAPANLGPLSRGLLVVASARGAERPEILDALLEEPRVQRVLLEPMTPEELSSMMRSMLGLTGAREAPTPLVDAVISRAQGNPFQASELLDVAVKRGALSRREGRWELEEGEDWEQALDAVVHARLAGLAPEARDLVQTLALLERSAPAPLTARLGQRRHVDELVESGFLERLRGDEVAFAHDRLREAISQSIPEQEVSARHARIVRALQEEREAFAGELAHHRMRAGDRQGALEELLALARDPALQNTQPHRALSCYDEVATLDRAHDLLEAPMRAQVGVEHTRLMSFVGDRRAALEKAEALLMREEHSAAGQVELLWCTAHSAISVGAVRRAQDALERAVAAWGGLDEGATREEFGGRLHWLRGYVLRELGELEQAERSLERAQALATPIEDLHTQGLIQRTFGQICYDLRDTERALKHLSSSLDLLRQVGDRWTSIEVLLDLASVAQSGHDPDKALGYAEAANAQHLALFGGKPHPRAISVLAVFARQQGRLDEAVALNERACALFEEQHNLRSLAQTYSNLGVALQYRGDLVESIACYEKTIELSEQLGRPQTTGAAMLNCSTGLMRLGRLKSSRLMASKALAQFEHLGDVSGACKARWTTSLCLGLDAQLDAAFELTQEIHAPLLEHKQWDVLGYHAAFQGWIRCEQGRLGDARECFERAQDMMASTKPQRVNVVRCLILRGRYLRLARRTAHALSTLSEAHALASSIGATYELGRVDCELASLASQTGERARAQVLLDRAQRLSEILECAPLSWLGRGVLEVAESLAR